MNFDFLLLTNSILKLRRLERMNPDIEVEFNNKRKAPLHQGQLRSVVGNSPIMGGDPTIGGNPTTGWYSTQHLVGILTIFTIDAI